MGRGAGGDAGQGRQAKGRPGGRWGASGGPAGSAPTVGSGAQPSDAGPRLGWGAALPAFPALTPWETRVNARALGVLACATATLLDGPTNSTRSSARRAQDAPGV